MSLTVLSAFERILFIRDELACYSIHCLQRIKEVARKYTEYLWNVCSGKYEKIKGNIMGIASEFKEFAVKGNVVDMAVGIIIGGAFGKVVASVVNDVLMPPLGLLLGGVNFTDLAIILKEAVPATADVAEVAAVSLNYGKFIQTGVDFLIVAFAVFLLVKGINSLRRKQEQSEKKA